MEESKPELEQAIESLTESITEELRFEQEKVSRGFKICFAVYSLCTNEFKTCINRMMCQISKEQ